MGKKSQKLCLLFFLIVVSFQNSYVEASVESEWKQTTWNTERDELGQCVWGKDEYFYIGGLHTDTNNVSRHILMKWNRNGRNLWHTLGIFTGISTVSLWADSEYAYLLGMHPFSNYTSLRNDLSQYTAQSKHEFSVYFVHREEFLFDIMGYENRYYTVGYITNSSQENPNINMTLVKWYDAYMGVSPQQDSRGLWAYEFDENQDEIGYDLWVDDTGIFTLGYTEDHLGNQKMLLMQWYFSGGMKWKKVWSIPSCNIVGKSVIAKDGNLYTLGTKQLNNTSDSDLVLIGWDENGNELWNSTWGGSDPEIAESVWIVQNSIYCVGHTNGRVFMVEFNLEGDFIRNHTIPEVFHYSDFNRIWGDDNCLYITGYSITPQEDTALELLQFFPNGIRRIPGNSSYILISIIALCVAILMIHLMYKKSIDVNISDSPYHRSVV